MNIDGSQVTRLTTNEANDGLPIWSPGGQTIAFVSDRSGEWAIWAMNPDGTAKRQLFALGGSLDGIPHSYADYEAKGWLEERTSWCEVD